MARLGAHTVTRHTLAVHVLLLVGTHPDASPVVFEQVLGALLDARGPVGVLALGVLLPRVLYRVVSLHGRTLLLAHTVVVKVAAG